MREAEGEKRQSGQREMRNGSQREEKVKRRGEKA